jgi:hypothetical protein
MNNQIRKRKRRKKINQNKSKSKSKKERKNLSLQVSTPLNKLPLNNKYLSRNNLILYD